MSTLTLSPGTVATLPYPILGGSQHLCLVRHSKSQRLTSPFMLDWQQLPNTVLASAFLKGAEVSLPVPLEPPFDRLVLPPLTLRQLDPKLAKDQDGRVIGMLLSVPGLYVHANNILFNAARQNPHYNYRHAIAQMSVEAARMLASVIRSGVLRVRERPGIMGHAVALGELAHDEVGISFEFATTLYHRNKKRLADLARNVWQLDGFPCWGIRFPVANEFGIQPKVLRVLQGRGQFVGFNPWDLGKRYLGDQDGDLGFSILRSDDVLDGRAFIEKRPHLNVDGQVTAISNPLTLQGILNPSLLPVEPKLQDKMRQGDLGTLDKRLGFIEDCDTRTFVAVFTMIFGWWCPRVLATSGGMGIQEAYIKSHQALEWFMESSMDGRKEGSPFTTPGFNCYQFMDTLMQGGTLDFDQLAQIGAPAHAIETLTAAWDASEGKLRADCRKSPVYDAFVLRRRSMNESAIDMLDSLQQLGVEPADLYRTILDDLTCLTPLEGNTSRAPSCVGDLDFDNLEEF